MRVTFYGGAGAVTGSNFLVEAGESRVLVDCGIQQGKDFCEEEAYGPFPYDPKTINALIITHAHLDHVGKCPKLVADGFSGAVYMTAPTRDLTELILRDSVDILREEAMRIKRSPLYTDEDVTRFLSLIKTVAYHDEWAPAPAFSAYLRNTGHILGSSSVRIQTKDASVAFTSDIGNSPSPLLPDWEPITDADALVMESVYGDRVHPNKEERVDELASVLREGLGKGGPVLIPAFSLERTQLMLYELSHLFSAGKLPHVPVFLDSPLAIRVTSVYETWGPTYFKDATKDEMAREGDIFAFPFLIKTLSRAESDTIADTKGAHIIIAGAGMSHGGRIGRWERRYLGDPRTTLIIVGYQAPGSPGRLLQEGAGHVRVAGEGVAVKARVRTLEGWSGHADRDGLLRFAQASLPRTKTIFTALGEPSAERFLAQRIHDFLGARAVVPEIGQSWDIIGASATKTAP